MHSGSLVLASGLTTASPGVAKSLPGATGGRSNSDMHVTFGLSRGGIISSCHGGNSRNAGSGSTATPTLSWGAGPTIGGGTGAATTSVGGGGFAEVNPIREHLIQRLGPPVGVPAFDGQVFSSFNPFISFGGAGGAGTTSGTNNNGGNGWYGSGGGGGGASSGRSSGGDGGSGLVVIVQI